MAPYQFPFGRVMDAKLIVPPRSYRPSEFDFRWSGTYSIGPMIVPTIVPRAHQGFSEDAIKWFHRRRGWLFAEVHLFKALKFGLDERTNHVDPGPTIHFEAPSFFMQKVPNDVQRFRLVHHPCEQLFEFRRDHTESALKPPNRQQWPKHIEVFLNPHLLAPEVLSKVAASHVQIVIHARR